MVSRQNVLNKIFGDPQARIVKGLERRVGKINGLAEKYHAMSDSALKAQTDMLRERCASGEKLDDILPDAFAVVREAATRTLGMRHFDVQLMGGIALHEGNVAELKTGEGKTFMATLPIYLNALEGKGVHLVTVNDYLAQRDAGWMGGVYEFLGMTTGVIINDASFVYDKEFNNDAHDDPRMRKLRPATRKEAYAAHVTYGTNNEFGFDYLRDNMANDVELLRQRELNFAIVDEVDSILIDEARTPLIISAPAQENPENYYRFAEVATRLTPEDYILDEKHRSVSLSDTGVEKVENILGVTGLYSPEHVQLVYHLDQALRAQVLFKRDKDYVVTSDGEVVIVDEHTGRLMQGRRYNEGLHQAIEAKEAVTVREESMTLATISFQNYFRLYNKLSGMTGTAFTEAEEFQQIYGLDVIVIPPNKPLTRIDHDDLIFKTEAGKIRAISAAIKEYHDQGRPVLIGSASIAKNELIATHLAGAGLPFELLNAKNNEREAAIIAKAGEKGAITLATNIAGRGTDIVLSETVRSLGGLVVIGSERHESRRIDNQLRGRSGRQGDPGETQFYVSTEDDLMRIFQGERIAALMDRLGVDEDQPIQNKAVSKTLEAAQKRVEGYHFDIRKSVVQYDNVINRHRRVVYTMRRRILEGLDIKPEIERLIGDKLLYLARVPAKNDPNFYENFETFFGLIREEAETIGKEKKDKLRMSMAKSAVQKLYETKEAEIGSENMRKVEREVYLQVLDTLWMQHLENMQHLREGIHWRSIGQRDPLVEYRAESQRLFESLQATLRDEVIRALMHVEKQDAVVRSEEEFNTELTRRAEKAVALGVNEVTEVETFGSEDFKVRVAKPVLAKKDVRKKKKSARQNKKKGRR